MAMTKRFIYKDHSHAWKIGRESRQWEGISITNWKACEGRWSVLKKANSSHKTLKDAALALSKLGYSIGKKKDCKVPMYEIVRLK